VSAWPYSRPEATAADNETAARALPDLHRSLADAPEPLPALTDRFTEVQRLLLQPSTTAALPDSGRTVLARALEVVAGDMSPDDIGPHAEPHDRNRLVSGGAVLYFDFEATCRGPLEWDLAYMDQQAAESVWPEHDRDKCALLRIAVSACVSIY
jgi:Ser/Thr protein kinase RdoA (MazF antagonist)